MTSTSSEPVVLRDLPGAPAAAVATTDLRSGTWTRLGAGSVLVIASGPGKAEALEQLLRGPEDPAWPVTWLRRHPRLNVAVGPNL